MKRPKGAKFPRLKKVTPAKRSTAPARRSSMALFGGVAKRMAWLSGQGPLPH